MAKLRVKKGDVIQVIAGKNKGKRGVVKKVMPQESKVVVENVNVVTRHIRPDYRYPNGSFTKEMPIHVSNVAIVDSSIDKPGKVGYKLNENGEKIRFFKKTGIILPKV